MDVNSWLEIYREKGYIQELRRHIGHAPLIGVACGVIVLNRRGEILLQKRRDNGRWGIIGGAMEIGESVQETVIREAREEAGITIGRMDLFGIYSGMDRLIVYPNGDICYAACIVFISRDFEGTIVNQEEEVIEHRFFAPEDLPDEINEFDKVYIRDWMEGKNGIIVR